MFACMWQLDITADVINTTRASIAARAKLPNPARLVCRYRLLPEEVIGGHAYHRKSRCMNWDPSISDCTAIERILNPRI